MTTEPLLPNDGYIKVNVERALSDVMVRFFDYERSRPVREKDAEERVRYADVIEGFQALTIHLRAAGVIQ